jgi:hypothetical protein
MTTIVTFRNVITGDHISVEAGYGEIVRQAVEKSGLIPPGSQFSVRDKDGTVVDGEQATNFPDVLLQIGPLGNIKGGGGGSWFTIEEIAAGFIALKFLGPFAESFASKLGERLGDSAADAASRIRLLRRGGRNPQRTLVIQQGTAETAIVVPEQLSDDAWLALVDLDVTADGVRGAIIRWDNDTRRWRPVGRDIPATRTSKSIGSPDYLGNVQPDRSYIILRSAHSNKRVKVLIQPDMTLKHAVLSSGLISKEITDLIIRDENQNVVSETSAYNWAETVITIMLPNL